MTFHRAASLLALTLLVACGSSATPPAPTILSQPVDATVAPGTATTFYVEVAPGLTPATYQWTWNGAVVAGATGSTYTTRPAEVADDGSEFAVTVSNSIGSVTSKVATLTVSPVPRAPRRGDMRFQGVGAAPFRNLDAGGSLACGPGGTFEGALGTPVQMVAGDGASPSSGCNRWAFQTVKLPPSSPQVTSSYRSASYYYGDVSVPDLSMSVWNLAFHNGGVVTSLDFADAVSGSQSFVWSELASGTYYGNWLLQTLSPRDLADHVAYEASVGRVVTAVTSYGGAAWAASYAWQPEEAVVYEASLRPTSVTTLAEVASGLASEGYIITALGRDGAGGLLLVGTREQGDTMSRPLVVQRGADAPGDLLARGYAIVGLVYDATASSWIWIAEQ